MGLSLKPPLIIHRKIAWLLVFLIVSSALVSWLIYIGKAGIEETNARMNQTYELIGTFRQINNTISEAEADAYRYQTSGDPAAAQRLGAARDTLDQQLKTIQQLSAQSHDQEKNITLLGSYLATNRSNAKPLLATMIREETAVLETRKRLNDKANDLMAKGLVLGRIAGFLFMAIILIQLNKDLSRRKKMQEDLVIAMQAAEEARLQQEQFLANMSHEIRTPMNGVKGMTDLLLATPLSDKQQEFAGVIKNSVDNLLVIINDILDFSKIKAGKLTLEKIDFSIPEALSGTAALFEHRLKEKGLTLRTELDPEVPVMVNGDPYRLNQVLINLLGNAIKFTEQGEIRIQVAAQMHGEREVRILFTVSDTGIGIAEDHLPYIFDSFSQAGRDISRLYGGTGLGLSICRQLLHLQGGDIDATSKTGAGSVFHFYIPYGYSAVSIMERPGPESRPDYKKRLSGKRFLVVEDNEVNQKLIDHVLKRVGGDTELAGNGREALASLKGGNVYALIIMDLQMPEMDGYATTRAIRSELGLQTPIIAMTATATDSEELQCLQTGMNAYMTKPFEFDELYRKIDSLIS